MRTKLLALFLILAMSLSLFVACGDKENETDAGTKEEVTTNGEITLDSSDTTTDEIATEAFPEIDKNDYGEEFYLIIQGDSNVFNYHWIEESKGDTMTEAVYNRQEQVRQYLGVEIVGQNRGGGSAAYVDDFKTAVKNKDDSVHLFVSHVYGGLVDLTSGGYLTAYENMPAINLDADYWSAGVMDELSIGGKTYLGKSRFNILYTFVVAYNKDMMAQYADAMDNTVYEMVDNYQWTLDQMISLIDLVHIDTTADGKTADDTYGISADTGIPMIGMLQASNINIVEQNEKGDYVVSVYNELYSEKTVSVVEKLRAMYSSASAYMFDSWTDAGKILGLDTGRVLMTCASTNSLEKLSTFDLTFGVLPYPLYDEAQKDVGYRHLQWGGYLAVPSYLSDAQMVGETIEMLSYYSADVNNAYYDKMLGKQASDMPEDRKMLTLVWDTIVSDLGQPYSQLSGGNDLLYLIPRLIANTDGVASFVATNERNFNKAMEKFIKMVSKLN